MPVRHHIHKGERKQTNKQTNKKDETVFEATEKRCNKIPAYCVSPTFTYGFK
jgi:hypothetical protein